MKYIIEDSVPVNHIASLETDFRVQYILYLIFISSTLSSTDVCAYRSTGICAPGHSAKTLVFAALQLRET